MVAITIKEDETGELKELRTIEYDNNGALLYYFEDDLRNQLTEHLSPYNPVPLHTIFQGGEYLLNGRMVLVVDIDKD